jgi:hypothetical protein
MLPVMVPIVHVNVLAAVAVNAIFVAVPLQIAAVFAVVTDGVGLTVTVIVYGAPGQVVLAVDVGVTMYWTVPAALLLGLFKVWAIVAPLPALAPVMPPVIVPIVQVNVLGAVAVKEIFVAVPLQIDAVFAVVTAGVGLTVTVIVCAGPWQAPAVDVGTTTYSTVPAALLLGLVNVCAIVLPEPAVAPVILPATVPIVHANVLGVLAVKAILVAMPLQIAAVGAVVTSGVGWTVTVAMILNAVPTHPFSEVGVTRYSTEPEDTALGFVSTWLITLPDPALAPLILPTIVPIVQVNVLGTVAVNEIFGLPPLQIAAGGVFVTAGSGLTVTVIV